jgi:uncharacterized protein DUF3159
MNNRQVLTMGGPGPDGEPPGEAGTRPAHRRAYDPETASGWAAIRQTWSDPQRWAGIVLAAAPSLVFVAVNLLASLYPAIIAAAVTAAAGLGYRLVRRQSPRSALAGILIVAVGAILAAVTGEARGFFLVPTLIPFAVILICLATIVARRPLTGLILNRVTGGPPDWYRNPALRRVHLVATAAALAINVVNATVQAIFYGRGDTAVLAVAHVATGPIFATLVAVTVVAARRTLAAQR